MTKADSLRSKFTNWKSSPGPDTENALMESCIVSIRAIVHSVLPRRDDLWDAAESDAIDQVWSKLDTCSGDIAGFVRLIARNKALDQLRSEKRSKVDSVEDFEKIDIEEKPVNKIEPNLSGLTRMQRQVADLLIDGLSQDNIAAKLKTTRKKVRNAMDVIGKVMTART